MAIETEAQRQFYLGMAGIHCWYARAPQPGAAASPLFDFDEPDADKSRADAPFEMPVANPDKREQRKAGIAGVRGLMGDSAGDGRSDGPPRTRPGPASAPVKANSGAVETKPSSEVAKVPPTMADAIPAEPRSAESGSRHFVTANWGFWCAGPWLLVSALSPDASHQLQDNLAKNILKALAAEVDSAFNLQWPVFNNPAVAGNDRAGFGALLRDLRRDWPDQRLIALGLCQGDDWPDRLAWLGGSLGEPAVDFEYSLPALATDPGRKRALWSRLRPLVSSSD